MTQPQPPDPNHRRYTTRPFPPYRFVPGLYPHPRRHSDGHSYGAPEPVVDPTTLSPEQWRQNQSYLYGIDLYNFAYWWECHEELEAIWHAVQNNYEQAEFLKGIIQVAAANLRRFMDPRDGGISLYRKAIRHLSAVTGDYMGIAIETFRREIESYESGKALQPPLIELQIG